MPPRMALRPAGAGRPAGGVAGGVAGGPTAACVKRAAAARASKPTLGVSVGLQELSWRAGSAPPPGRPEETAQASPLLSSSLPCTRRRTVRRVESLRRLRAASPRPRPPVSSRIPRGRRCIPDAETSHHNRPAKGRCGLAVAISAAFAQTIIDAQQNTGLDFDIVFGPAYKGIPLCSAIAIKIGEQAPQNLDKISYSFDRKEAKDHGEGGSIVGAPLKGKKVLIVDDVITAGTAKRDAIEKIRKEGGVVAGIVVALDRMERLPATDGDDSKPGPSAIGELRKEYSIPVFAILTLDDIIEGMQSFASEDDIKRTKEYRQKYKAID
ncbi:Orotate phosphoribosyltransferase [Tolypocladium capitatum]|uniref:Orotate phosphoribosyltransferase n=1 Tax=Tolypocladium capitatum TaxID=45235 RepID=A0A2K3QIH8_9HYPO|nr:Orotate phosphoribosyltransferase [Tolypocladium capitatum]